MKFKFSLIIAVFSTLISANVFASDTIRVGFISSSNNMFSRNFDRVKNILGLKHDYEIETRIVESCAEQIVSATSMLRSVNLDVIIFSSYCHLDERFGNYINKVTSWDEGPLVIIAGPTSNEIINSTYTRYPIVHIGYDGVLYTNLKNSISDYFKDYKNDSIDLPLRIDCNIEHNQLNPSRFGRYCLEAAHNETISRLRSKHESFLDPIVFFTLVGIQLIDELGSEPRRKLTDYSSARSFKSIIGNIRLEDNFSITLTPIYEIFVNNSGSSWSDNEIETLLSRVKSPGDSCPECSGSTKICSKSCPKKCNNSCTSDSNGNKCCTVSGMPLPP